MQDIVEVHWNARPHLQRLGIKVGSGDLNPRAEKLFDEIRGSASKIFPGAVAIVRIATRNKTAGTDLRITRCGQDLSEHEIEAMRTLIDQAIEHAVEPAEAA